jgi:hypothetical protein
MNRATLREFAAFHDDEQTCMGRGLSALDALLMSELESDDQMSASAYRTKSSAIFQLEDPGYDRELTL